MRGISDRLSYIWTALLETNLVKTKVPSKENLADFERMLNKVTPMTTQEKTTYDVFRHLSSISRVGFGKFLEDNRVSFLSLASDGGLIVNLLGLRDTINLKWDVKRAEYVVTELEIDTQTERKQWGDMPPPEEQRLPPRQKRNERGERNEKKNNGRNDRNDRKNNGRNERNDRNEEKRIGDKNQRKYPPRGDKREPRERPVDRPVEKPVVASILPPLSTELQANILNAIRNTKSFSDVVEAAPAIVTVMAEQAAAPLPVQSITADKVVTFAPDGTTTPVEITQEDLSAILSMVE